MDKCELCKCVDAQIFWLSEYLIRSRSSALPWPSCHGIAIKGPGYPWSGRPSSDASGMRCCYVLFCVFASLFTFTIKLQSPTFVVVFFWCHVWEGWSCPPSPLSPPPPLGDRRYTWDTRESYRRQGGHDTNSFSILADFMEKFVKKMDGK